MTNKVSFRSNADFAIHVTDLEKARVFYADVLGLKLLEQSENKLVFDTGKFTLYVNSDEECRAFIPAFEVPDFEAAKTYLETHGRPIVREWPEYRALYFKDPFGIVIDIIERKGKP